MAAKVPSERTRPWEIHAASSAPKQRGLGRGFPLVAEVWAEGADQTANPGAPSWAALWAVAGRERGALKAEALREGVGREDYEKLVLFLSGTGRI